MIDNFAAFILSHGRPDKIFTYKTLLASGYTGKIFIIIDNQDKTSDEYYKKYGDKVLMFDKPDIASKVDHGDNLNDLRTTIHARNAIFDFAEKLNIEYFIQLDDDYTSFQYLYDEKNKYIHRKIRNINKIFEAFILFLEKSNALSIAFLQGGDLIGGELNYAFYNNKYPFQKRKCMNSFFCKTSRRFWFISRLNEDVNTYLTLGNIGKIFMTIPLIMLNQKTTQATSGGMTESYLNSGTYIKSFYSVMYCPSFVKIKSMGLSYPRLHHFMAWDKAIPKIISERYK